MDTIRLPNDFKDFLKLLNLHYKNKISDLIDDINIDIINLAYLKKNKKASGRLKDLNDLEYLP